MNFCPDMAVNFEETTRKIRRLKFSQIRTGGCLLPIKAQNRFPEDGTREALR